MHRIIEAALTAASVFQVHLSEHNKIFVATQNLLYSHRQVMIVEIMALARLIAAACHRQAVGTQGR